MKIYYKLFSVFLIVAMGSGAGVPTAEAQEIFTKDKSRKVSSFADALEPVLPSHRYLVSIYFESLFTLQNSSRLA